MAYILDSVPYRIVFVDTDHIIRYMNREAKHHYYMVRGYGDLIGKSIFECHSEKSKEMLIAAVEKLKAEAAKTKGADPMAVEDDPITKALKEELHGPQ